MGSSKEEDLTLEKECSEPHVHDSAKEDLEKQDDTDLTESSRGGVEDESGNRGGDAASSQDDDSSDTDNETEAASVLDRVVSHITSRSSIDPGPPPDGGWLAWSQCTNPVLFSLTILLTNYQQVSRGTLSSRIAGAGSTRSEYGKTTCRRSSQNVLPLKYPSLAH